ncbi:DUF3103 family protein [Actinacidiphila alni]|uniref:DUF3103 family protein n=1 Tax=Actinacidiphila alni TaxID=380248 RepID=UPI00340B7883
MHFSLTPVRRGAVALALCAASLTALQAVALPAASASPASSASSGLASVSGIEDATARTVAASLADPAWRDQVRTAALGSAQVDLASLTARAAAPAALNSRVTAADRGILRAKGLAADAGSLLRLRLGADSMRGSLLRSGASPLVAAAGTDDKAAAVVAYDSNGRAHRLSSRTVPNVPVYVVDIDVTKAVSAGLATVNRQFTARGLDSPAVAAPRTAGFWTTRVDSVYLNDDEEPWILGDAEIFSIVSGFGLDGKVRVDTVDMPYLDDDHTTYYPNQILVNWSNYKYNLADVVMMEDDGDTNYADLAKALADALLTITDQGAYIPLVDAILAAIPSSWYTNDADYVDSWYTLAQSSTGRLTGARANGWMTVSPYFVSQL